MTIKEAPLKGLLIIEPRVFKDPRGYFLESYRYDKLEELGFFDRFVQDNESKSQKGVVRGLHMQNPPRAQDKLIRVVHGSILDVAVDIRKSSPTYGQHFTIELSGENKRSLLVPKGFAHGFHCLEDDTIVQYRCSDYYAPETEAGIQWNDPELGIDWQLGDTTPVVSDRDRDRQAWANFESHF